MSEWKEYNLDDLGELLNNKRIPLNSMQRESKKGVFPYYGASGIVDYIDDYIFDGSYLLISEDGENLRSRQTPIAFKATGKFWVNNHAHIFKGKFDWVDDFVRYVIENLDLSPYITGAVQPKLNKENLLRIPIRMLSEDWASKVTKILSSLDDKIELNNAINKNLEELAQTIFKRWFVDFEFPMPEDYAASIGKPELAGQPYKSSGGEMVESEMGMIPKGWEVLQLSNVFDFISGFPFKGETFSKSGHYGIATIKNVQDGKFVIQTDNFIDEIPNKLPQDAILNIGDILMSLTGNVGRVCFVTKENFVLNQRVVKFKGLQENTNAFWYYFFRQNSVKELLISISKGTAQLNLSPVETKSLRFVLPRSFNENMLNTLSKIFDSNVACSVENNKLSNLRDTLLPKLISGQIEIQNV